MYKRQGLFLFSIADKGWMVFAFAIPLSLGGLCGPALQGIMTNNIPDNEQGEFQGGITSLISLTSIVGPLIMTNLFYFFTNNKGAIYFPGAPFLLAAIISTLGLIVAVKFLNKSDLKT